ncbi:glycosyltransferase family 2 protein [uncultured Sulfitobacter sp.]|uniref:glycosyltransferase family 2 protein n=1 Tax=uncultured Sulfitobacter sp. TaxID=191468 RepID=UPI00262E0188|nr:glycosyltransferase family 2 protein [uncultured Sulfitobacter sp.]
MIQATVIIPAWNSESTLRASVESALAQTEVFIEIIVVDDCSTDGTRAVAGDLADAHSQVRALTLARNGGPAAARNAALATAKGVWVAVLDADDKFCTGRLAALTEFGDRAGADIVCDGLVMHDAARDTRRTAVPAFGGDPEARDWTLGDYIAGNMHGAKGLSLGYLKPVFRRSFLLTHGMRYDETLRNGEDFHFVLEALARGAVMRYRADPGYVYSVGQISISHRLNPDHAEALAHADLAFVARHERVLDAGSAAMMRQRARSILDLASAEVALAALRHGKPVAAARALWRRRRATYRFLRQLAEAAATRLHRH